MFAMACIYLWAVFFQFGWGPCCWILVRYVSSNVKFGLSMTGTESNDAGL
jgi:hypothetical protein